MKQKLLSTKPTSNGTTFFRPFKIVGPSEWVCSDNDGEERLIDVKYLENLERYSAGPAFFGCEEVMDEPLYPHDVYGEYTACEIREGLVNFLENSIDEEDLVKFWKDNNLEKLIYDYMTK